MKYITCFVLASFLVLGLCSCMPDDYFREVSSQKQKSHFSGIESDRTFSDRDSKINSQIRWDDLSSRNLDESSKNENLRVYRTPSTHFNGLVSPGFGDLLKDVGSGIKHVGSDIKHGVQEVGKGVANVGSHVAHDVVAVGQGIGSFIEQGVRSFFEIGKEVHNVVVSKLSQLYILLHRRKFPNRRTSIVVRLGDLPMFSDPLTIDHLDEHYKLGNVTFSNVVLQGLSNFKNSRFEINFQKNTADLYLYANEMVINGKYKMNALLNHHSGDFHLNMYNNITYRESYKYEQRGSSVDIVTESFKMEYGKIDNTYENIGFITQIFQGSLSSVVLKEVETSIHKEISSKMRSFVVSKMKDQLLGYGQGSMSGQGSGDQSTLGHGTGDSSMSGQGFDDQSTSQGYEELIGETLKSIESEIHARLTSGNYSALTFEDSQMEPIKYGNLMATASSAYIKGLEKFKLDNYHVKTEEDKITVTFVVKANSLGGGVTLAVKNEANLNEAVQRIHTPFSIEELRMEFNVTSRMEAEQIGFEKAVLRITVQNLRVELQENYEMSVYELITNQLPNKLAQFIMKTMDTLIQNEAASFFSEAKLSYSSSVDKY